MVSLLYCMSTSVYHPDGAGLGGAAGTALFTKLLNEAGFTQTEEIGKDQMDLFYLCTK